MEQFIALLNVLRSPRLSAVVLLFSSLILFLPYDDLGLGRPEFVSNYEAIVLTAMTLSASVLLLEVGLWLVGIALRPFASRARRRQIEEIFNSLNLDELCVLFAMTQGGTRVVKGSVDNHVMVSLREKGALHLMTGFQSLMEANHSMPSDLFEYVAHHAFERFPADFKDSPRFVDEVRQRCHRSTTWHTY